MGEYFGQTEGRGRSIRGRLQSSTRGEAMDRTELEEVATAFHEAGHAVMSYALGNDVYAASIEPNDETAGRCRSSYWTGYPMLKWLAAFAGPIAQSWVTDDSTGCDGDYDRIGDIIIEIGNAE